MRDVIVNLHSNNRSRVSRNSSSIIIYYDFSSRLSLYVCMNFLLLHYSRKSNGCTHTEDEQYVLDEEFDCIKAMTKESAGILFR